LCGNIVPNIKFGELSCTNKKVVTLGTYTLFHASTGMEMWQGISLFVNESP